MLPYLAKINPNRLVNTKNPLPPLGSSSRSKARITFLFHFLASLSNQFSLSVILLVSFHLSPRRMLNRPVEKL